MYLNLNKCVFNDDVTVKWLAASGSWRFLPQKLKRRGGLSVIPKLSTILNMI